MQETYRVDAMRDLAAAQRELAAEIRAERQELTTWRTEMKVCTNNVVEAVGGSAQWCGIGLVLGMLLMAAIGKFGVKA